mmetsp:Transcript_46955/g.52535  ORF Transcript_46955/g.52535 Transcript_46955/m.52535 type:complete len:84 (+) Transcript_46955:2114-2365(+)
MTRNGIPSIRSWYTTSSRIVNHQERGKEEESVPIHNIPTLDNGLTYNGCRIGMSGVGCPYGKYSYSNKSRLGVGGAALTKNEE